MAECGWVHRRRTYLVTACDFGALFCHDQPTEDKLNNFFLFRGVVWGWVHLVHRPLIGLLHQHRMMDEYGAYGGMRIGRGTRTRRKPAPMQLCPPQIPHELIWGWTRAAAVGNRRITVWAMAQPNYLTWYYNKITYLSSTASVPMCRQFLTQKVSLKHNM